MQTLREGATGVSVQILQTALKRVGENPGEIDGEFGPMTRRAVLAFQSREGIEKDGIVGRVTWSRLEPYLTGYVLHTVSRGDSFYRIAQKYDTTVSAIRTANPYLNPLNLQVGSLVVVPLSFDVVPTDIPLTSELVELIVKGLVMRFPFLRSESAGKSVLGRDLYVIRMGEGEREVFYNATHHANEWITTTVLLKYVEDIAGAYAEGENVMGLNVRELFRSVTMYVMPLVNPDGMDIVTGGISESIKGYAQAKQIADRYPSVRFPLGWKANIEGTDLNLNYPAGWEIAKQIKAAQGIKAPAPRDYVGEEPLSAPESRAVYDFTLAHDFSLVIAYHTQGMEIYWRYLDYQPEGALAIGKEFERVSGYRLKLTPPQSSYAGYKDWFILEYNRPGYTVEAGRGTNPLPISQFPQIYRDNFGILTTGLKER